MVVMPLDRKEMTRLIQLLGMTGSDLDTEALTFLRGAQKLESGARARPGRACSRR